MFINKSAAERITGFKVVKIWYMNNGSIGVVIILKTGKKRSTILSRKAFFQDAIVNRKFNALTVEVVKEYEGTYETKSIGSERVYQTVIRKNEISCSCTDYKNQATYGNGFKCPPVCKHLYGTLTHLWVDSFKAAIELSNSSTQETVKKASAICV